MHTHSKALAQTSDAKEGAVIHQPTAGDSVSEAGTGVSEDMLRQHRLTRLSSMGLIGLEGVPTATLERLVLFRSR